MVDDLLLSSYTSLLESNAFDIGCEASNVSSYNSNKYGMILSYLLRNNKENDSLKLLTSITNKINQLTIKGWCSNYIKNGELFGWFLNTNNFNTRVVLVIINKCVFEVECNSLRKNPKKYVNHRNNGFRLLLDKNFVDLLPKKTPVVLVDKQTNITVFSTTITKII